MRHLQSLTPLRGIAALTVVMFHLARDSGDPSVPAFFLRGYLGVDLFFVLSGFVLTHVYVPGFLGDASWRSVGAFLWARVARLYPVHLFVAALLVAGGSAQGLSGLEVLDNFLLILVPWPIHAINPPSWSLSAEWYAYLLFPLMVGYLWRCNGRIAAALCFALLLGLDIVVVGVFGNLREIGVGWGALARALPEFAVGVITYRAFSDPRVAGMWRSDAAFLAVAASLVLAVEFVPNDGVVVALLPLLLLAAVSNAGLAARLLNAAPLRWMGDISYSVYLGQTIAFSVAPMMAATGLGPLLGLNGLRAFTVAATLAIGTLIYRCVEVPCRTLLRRAPDGVRRLAARA
jgi:peptidoglycan/LPS O-acetylase OafA/YrhL